LTGIGIALLRVALFRIALLRVGLLRVALLRMVLLRIAVLRISLLWIAVLWVAGLERSVFRSRRFLGCVGLVGQPVRLIRVRIAVARRCVCVVLGCVGIVRCLIWLLRILLRRVRLLRKWLLGVRTLGIDPVVRGGLGLHGLIPPSSRIPAQVVLGLLLSRVGLCLV